MRQCDMRATAKASDGMLISAVPIRGCRSPEPPGPTSAFKKFQEIGLGLLPTATGGRATGTPTSVTALGGILAGSKQALLSHDRPCPTATPSPVSRRIIVGQADNNPGL
jgi:hypothetical protein